MHIGNARDAAIVALNAAADVISDGLRADGGTYVGRVASIRAESTIRNLIARHKTDCISAANKNLSSKWKLNDIDTSVPNDESARRRMDDMSIVMQNTNTQQKVWLPINIKATVGGSSDNVCGWNAFSWCLFRNKELHTMQNVLTYCAAHQICKDDSTDYLLWTFYKDDNGKLIGTSYASSLLLDCHANMLQYNDAQSFPVQVKQPSMSHVRQATETIMDASTCHAQRIQLFRFVIGNKLNHARHIYDLCDAAIVAQQQSTQVS